MLQNISHKRLQEETQVKKRKLHDEEDHSVVTKVVEGTTAKKEKKKIEEESQLVEEKWKKFDPEVRKKLVEHHNVLAQRY